MFLEEMTGEDIRFTLILGNAHSLLPHQQEKSTFVYLCVPETLLIHQFSVQSVLTRNIEIVGSHKENYYLMTI